MDNGQFQNALLDLFGDTALTGIQPFPHHLLPPLLQAFTDDVADRVGTDPAMPGMAGLGTLAAAIRDEIRIQPKQYDPEWQESVRLWICIVAPIGAKKSPVLHAALAPLRAIERTWFTEDERRRTKFEQEQVVYKAALAEAARRQAKGTLVPLPPPPLSPPMRRRVIQDATIEAVADILCDNPEGCPAVFDELAAWFGSFDAYRQGGQGRDRAYWLEAFNGGPRLIDRVKRGRVSVPNWGLSLLGMTQPEPLRRLAGKLDDDGLPQRFTPVFAEQRIQGKDRRPGAGVIEGYQQLIQWAVGLQPPSVPYLLSGEAQQVQAALGRMVEDLMVLPTVSAAFCGHLAKWPGMFARWLLAFHIGDHAPGAIPRIVSGECAERVFSLMVDYLLPNAARFYTELLGQRDHVHHARWVANFILSQKKARVSARDIGRAYRELRSDLPAIQRTMSVLTLANWTTPLDGPQKDGPTKWAVNPAVHTLFAARAAEEHQRREAVKERIREAARNLGLKGEDSDVEF